MRDVRVLKFGGAALRDAASIRRAAGLIRRFGGPRPVVVVSAVEGVTRLLADALEAAARGRLTWDALRIRHRSLLTGLGLPGDLLDRHLFDLRGVLSRLAADPGDPSRAARSSDFVLSFGERMSARVVAATLARAGRAAVPVDAYDAGLVTEHSGTLAPPRAAAARVHRALVNGPAVPVVTGFVALDAAGHVTTLGANGSDLSAVWIGAALEAEEIQLWKEVPGILRADPALVPGAALLATIGRAEAAALARHGAAVLHPAALAPLAEGGPAVWLRDVRDPEAGGTRIVGETAFAGPLAIAHRSGLALLELVWSTRPGPDRAPLAGATGTRAAQLADLFEWLGRAGIELVGCQAGPERVQVLVASPSARPLDVPRAGAATIDVHHGLAGVTVVGRALAEGGDAGARLFAAVRECDPGAQPWADADVPGALVSESAVAACVRTAHDALFGRGRLESPAAG